MYFNNKKIPLVWITKSSIQQMRTHKTYASDTLEGTACHSSTSFTEKIHNLATVCPNGMQIRNIHSLPCY